MEKLSVVIITFNEGEHLSKCLDSVKAVADEVLVLDSFSTDRTQEICIEAGVRFYEHTFDGYVSQKNRAMEMASHNLILSLDGDEALSEEASLEILKLKENPLADGYVFNRRNNYCGKWMRYTSLYPDRKLRLFDPRLAKWTGHDPHDRIEMPNGANICRIQGDILHWVISDRADHLRKIDNFSTVAAEAYFSKGIKKGLLARYSHSLWRLLVEFIFRGGLMEGRLGWQFSFLSAKYVYLKYKKLSDHYAKGN
ncbi:MAG: glycosyltransferase family 2 protein [Bacteroidota bacterium]|nr:glycosyltransferase family 2 protein [Bacteroidota bacterium]